MTTEQPVTRLSAYFGNSETATDAIYEAFEPEQVDMKEYVENISKISLLPLQRGKKLNLEEM